MSLSSPTSPVLALQRVSKRFGSLSCLNEVTICIAPGESVALVGGNGSGKTSLLDVTCGFIAPNSGTVLINGSRGTGRHPAWFAAHGVLRTFQSPRVFEQMTVKDCLILSGWVPNAPSLFASFMRPRGYCQTETRALAQATRALADAEWVDYASHLAGQLSYGQRKFLSILQLSLASGTIAICDEPTAGLDANQAARVSAILKQWQAADINRSILVATHDLEYVRSGFDRAYRIAEGRIEEM